MLNCNIILSTWTFYFFNIFIVINSHVSFYNNNIIIYYFIDLFSVWNQNIRLFILNNLVFFFGMRMYFEAIYEQNTFINNCPIYYFIIISIHITTIIIFDISAKPTMHVYMLKNIVIYIFLHSSILKRCLMCFLFSIFI